jgi:23S rRNA (pseudouridine1915-N3)-methyltransferase
VIKILIATVGKIKERWLEEGIDFFVKRLQPAIEVQFQLVKSGDLLIPIAEKPGRALALDAAGREMDSHQFSKYLFQEVATGGSRLTLFIGAAEGLPPQLKSSLPLISLSKMTFTHQTVRLMLLEQLYRAAEIAKGSPYVK